MEIQSPKFKVYGIPESVHRCYSCRLVRLLLERLGAPFEFIDVLSEGPDGITYDRPMLQDLAERIGQKHLRMNYPILFFDDLHIKNIKELRELLLSQGYDPDLVED